jgi:hypothetical protein
MTNFFSQCNTLDEVKHLYRNLAKEHHPDKGGNLQTMQEINNQYTKAINTIARGGKFTAQEAEAEILQAEAYQEAVNKVVNLEGCKLELIGSWLWITGATKQHCKILNSEPARFSWAKKKTDFSAWFFRTAEYKTTNKGQKMSIEAIRNKYGSQTITGSVQSYKLTA